TDEAEEVTDEAEEVTDEAEEVTDEAEEVTDEAEEVTDEAEEVTDEAEVEAGEIEVGVEEVEEVTDEVEVLEVVSDTEAEAEDSVSSDEPVFTFQKLEPVEGGADQAQEDEAADSESASTFGEWVDEESDEGVAEEHASSDASGWVDESAGSETDEAVVPQTEETSEASVPVAAVKQVAPAVMMTGLGAELPAASRFMRTRKTRLTGNKKAGKKRIYLSHWKGQPRSIVRRKGNRVS
ncbi:MAG: hypothetical protein P1V20_10240, partial [Verrucomicrobiales bacterium]|nr:hypothetical protein [Verrucomicrobiales bacterium]